MTFNYLGPFNRTGYGTASIGYLLGLLSLKIKPDLHIIGNVVPEDPQLKPVLPLTNLIPKEVKPNLPCFAFWHFMDLLNQAKRFTGPLVSFSTFEIDAFKEAEMDAINKSQLVGTASDWGASVLEKHVSKDRIFVAPHAYKILDTDVNPIISQDYDKIHEAWNNILAPLTIPKDTLIVSSAGKFELRKSHPQVLDACMEYGKHAPILLVAFWHNPFITYNYPFDFVNSRFLQPILVQSSLKVFVKDGFTLVLMPPTPTRDELLAALSNTHCFVSPSRGEGWNLPLFEAMSRGIPCSATLVGAHQDFCTSENVIPVKSSGLEVAMDGRFFDGTGNWHKVLSGDILTSIELVKKHLDHNTLSQIGANAYASLQNRSWQESARKIQTVMQKVMS